VKPSRRQARQHHHHLVTADRLLARLTHRAVAGTSGGRTRDIFARQPSIAKLCLNKAPDGFGGWLLHRFAKQSHGDFRLTCQDVGTIVKLMGLLDEKAGSFASLAGSTPQDCGGMNTTVEVATNQLDQLCLTKRASRSPVRLETICAEFKEPDMLGAHWTLERMRPAVCEQQRSLLVRQAAGATTVSVGDGRAIGLDHVVQQQFSLTAWARRRGWHRHGQAGHASALSSSRNNPPRPRR
jgi:hypothetical protein